MTKHIIIWKKNLRFLQKEKVYNVKVFLFIENYLLKRKNHPEVYVTSDNNANEKKNISTKKI